MFATKHMTLEGELVKWLVLLALAAALVLTFATGLLGAPQAATPAEPDQLPAEIALLAKPMGRAAAFFPETVPMDAEEGALLAQQLWDALEAHGQGNVETAIARWEQMIVPPATEQWRQLALGVAHLQVGDLAKAEDHLAAARLVNPHNAVIAYYFGILRLEQAAEAGDTPDANGAGAVRFVAHQPRVAPNTAAMLQLAAMMELKDAIAHAPELLQDELLAPEAGPAGPAVNELLAALGAVNFVGKAHHTLGELYLQRGLLTEAEENLDAAVATGLHVIYGYHDLGRAYEELDQPADAFRVYLKAVGQTPGQWVAPGRKAWENFWRLWTR